jgi:hypothetical protein
MRTKKTIVMFIGIIFVMVTGYSNQSSAEVNVNIGIGVPLPHVVIHSPPPVVVIPGTYAYFAPDVGVEIFFYHGYWYRPHHGYWYRQGYRQDVGDKRDDGRRKSNHSKHGSKGKHKR